MDDPNRPFASLDKALQDDKRIHYHDDYLSNLLSAIRQDFSFSVNLLSTGTSKSL